MKTNRASLQSRLSKREGQLSTSLSGLLLLLRVLGCAGLSHFLRERLNTTLLKVADGVFNLILQNAFLCMTPGKKSAKGMRGYVDPRALQVHLTQRAAIGCVLRRWMKPVFTQTDCIARIEGLLELLATKEKLVARLARRFSKGLTRNCFAHSRAPLAVTLGLAADACDIQGAALALTLCADALPDTS